MNDHVVATTYRDTLLLPCNNKLEIGDSTTSDTTVICCEREYSHNESHHATIGNICISWELL